MNFDQLHFKCEKQILRDDQKKRKKELVLRCFELGGFANKSFRIYLHVPETLEPGCCCVRTPTCKSNAFDAKKHPSKAPPPPGSAPPPLGSAPPSDAIPLEAPSPGLGGVVVFVVFPSTRYCGVALLLS
ncbi:Hypothetical predicted protein [Marmota monax]|uniref:Uncharacterized protein n=1 Tax=Marmota monax TaxID=9995 RepID=A0A5E4BQM5_MARMO|nr:Hypothetical predicted protein [Marmota monax]